MSRKVRVRATYHYSPNLFDRMSSPAGGKVEVGEVVRVINQHGCPPANTMGMCYIERVNDTPNGKAGQFLGMVCTNSLIPAREWPGYAAALATMAAMTAAHTEAEATRQLPTAPQPDYRDNGGPDEAMGI